jgi:transcriptional regulator with XRE-family HTH domain
MLHFSMLVRALLRHQKHAKYGYEYFFTEGVVMPVSPSPSIRRKRLIIELRRLREQADLTCEEVGAQLECSGTRISRIETGKIGVRPGDVRELLEVYGVTGPDVDALVQLAREARRKGWWHTYGSLLPSWFEAYVGLESDAVKFRDFQSMVLPGVLQTQDYARAVLRAAPTAGPADEIDRLVALRMERQGVLSRENPPDLWVVLGEGVLRTQVSDHAVMQAQLRHLLNVAERPNVTLQVLPFTTAAYVDPISPFTILEFAESVDPAVVYLEHLTGCLFVEDEAEVRRYRVVFDHLCAEALGTGQSIDLIARLSEELA